jgi:hypothetical protein
MYIHIYIFRERERERDKDRLREREKNRRLTGLPVLSRSQLGGGPAAVA